MLAFFPGFQWQRLVERIVSGKRWNDHGRMLKYAKNGMPRKLDSKKPSGIGSHLGRRGGEGDLGLLVKEVSTLGPKCRTALAAAARQLDSADLELTATVVRAGRLHLFELCNP